MRRAICKLRSNLAAFSLIEVAIVIAIVGLVLGGVWVAGISASMNLKTNQTIEGALQIINGTRKYFQNPSFSGQNYYNWTDEVAAGNTAVGASIIPADWVSSKCATNICNPFGGLFVLRVGITGQASLPRAVGFQTLVPTKQAANRLVRAILNANKEVGLVQCYQWNGSAQNTWSRTSVGIGSNSPGDVNCPNPLGGSVYIDVTLSP